MSAGDMYRELEEEVYVTKAEYDRIMVGKLLIYVM